MTPPTNLSPTRPDSAPAAAHTLPSLEDIRHARALLRGAIRSTPCRPCAGASAAVGARVYLKREDLQATGSFKERGARSALLSLPEQTRRRGVVAASAGNHAAGLAYHGRSLGIPVTIVVPRGAPKTKIANCIRHGATVVCAGEGFEASCAEARHLAREQGLAFVHPFDDPAVIAGQGTLGLELIEQLPGLDVLLLPVGGGGLLAGVATAVKALRPGVRIIAVEPERAPSWTAAVVAGRPVAVPVTPGLADGLGVARVGELNFRAAAGKVDSVVTVTEEEIAAAQTHLFEWERLVVEGAGATALAALLSGKLGSVRSATVAVPLTGCNVDANTFARALQTGAACFSGQLR